MAYESLQPTLWAGRLNKIMATRKRHSPEQIVRKLTLADRLLSMPQHQQLLVSSPGPRGHQRLET
ncbi:hypothetical protein B1T45_27515 [Mycobacterium kansasii]|nr:hypothetical protein B1T45_27515 [Mycobacterium kansasii]ARG72005.1 hypothetical protein B1T47_26915 [Mycobacterium kansasii]